MAAPANEQQNATFKLTKLKKKGTGDAHLASITCVDWTSALPNRLMSGSEVLDLFRHSLPIKHAFLSSEKHCA